MSLTTWCCELVLWCIFKDTKQCFKWAKCYYDLFNTMFFINSLRNIMYFHHICLHCSAPPKFLNPSQFPLSRFLVFLITYPIQFVFPYTQEYGTIYWSVVDLQEAVPLKKTDSSLAGSHQIPGVPQSGVEAWVSPPSMLECRLVWSCAGFM